MGQVIGLDWSVLYRLAEARGMDPQIVAFLLPPAEAGLLEAFEERRNAQ